MLELLAFPFMQRALLAGVLLGTLLALIGIFVVLKRMAFMSDGIAHASLSGAAIGILTGNDPLLTAIFFSGIFGALIAYFERKTKISSDAIIGLVFTTGMALGILLLSFGTGYRPELTTFLFGSILSIKWSEILIMAVFALLIGVFILPKYKKIALFILNEETAFASGIKIETYRVLLYVVIAISVVLGIKMLGIILVSALLIVPVTTAKLLSHSFRGLIVTSLIVSNLTVLLGLIASVILNLPTGATIVICGMLIFLLAAMYGKLARR
ncbi:MAG: metal ABC transporter permease [Patescibacteria group bacterium]